MLAAIALAVAFTTPLSVRSGSAVSATMMSDDWRRSYDGKGGGATLWSVPGGSAAATASAPSGAMTIEQACTFMYANDDATIEEKAAYLKSKGVSDFIIAQSTCCSALDRFGVVNPDGVF
uniref:Uncharacterized protein n=1 Tax=Haptolina brevifila TaxID=156173 RepID=A0A7S2JNA7_9EUKA